MNILTKTTIFSAAVVAMIGMAAVTADARPHKGLDFDALDTNADGFVTEQELTAAREKRFDEMDTDNDGALSAEEMKAHRLEQGGKYGKMWGGEHSKMRGGEHGKKWGGEHGKMGLADRSKMIFEKMDADKNGSISPEELAAAMEQRKGKWGKHGGKYGKKHGKQHGGNMGEHGQNRFMKHMKTMDQDGDGKITKAEMTGNFVAFIMEHLDTDKDGKISKEEAENARKMHKGKY